MQIGKDGDVADAGWPISRCLSSEMFNHLLFTFLGLEFTFHNIGLYGQGIGEFPTPTNETIIKHENEQKPLLSRPYLKFQICVGEKTQKVYYFW